MRNAAKSRKTYEDVLQYQSVQEVLDSINKMVEKEKAELVAPSATSASAEQQGSATAAAAADPGASAASAAGQGQSAQQAASEALVTKLGSDDSQQWLKHAEKILAQHVRLMVTPSTKAALVTELSSHHLGKVVGDPSGLVLIMHDVKLAAESATAPVLRMPPLKIQHYETVVSGVLAARNTGNPDRPVMNPGEVAIVLDGAKPGWPPSISERIAARGAARFCA